MTLIKSNTGKIDSLSRRLSQILSRHKSMWEGTQKEKLNQRIIAKIEKSNKTKEHEPECVVENENLKILWDFNIQCDHMIEARRPDIVVVDKVKKGAMIIDVAMPGDIIVCDKEREKIEKYSLLKDEIAKLWQMKKVVLIPIVVGALGTITAKFEKYIESLGIEIRIEHVQKSALLGTARAILFVRPLTPG